MGKEIRFVVPGEARPESKRTARAFLSKGGKVVQPRRYEEPDRRDWKADVRHAAALAMAGAPPLEGPLSVTVYVQKPPAPSWPKRATKANPWPWAWWKKPDMNNLLKPVEDACSSVVWHDDAQVVRGQQWKVIGDRHCVAVVVRAVDDAEATYARAVMDGLICELTGGCAACVATTHEEATGRAEM